MEFDMTDINKDTGTSGEPISPPKKKFRWKNILKGAAILFCGMIIGAVITAHVGHRVMFKLLGDPEHMTEKTTHMIERKLDLTSEQTEQVREIISRHAVIISDEFKGSHKRLRDEFELIYIEVSEVLDEKQKLKWKKHHDKMKKRHERHLKDEK
jgi:hypothetical protein